ncbi:efflux RND transporter periplasmic adaptor subunit [Gallaecimonas sp. GXIMD4217]|uniref:efflux RND transporter periplasmic adaptor subunit n=1 Tax=Gallaecimonas sp. GXIMD4217 TaxID=3131927 RepID=UPI00311AC2FF
MKYWLTTLVLLLAGCGEPGQWQKVEKRSAQQWISANGELASSDTAYIGPPSIDNMWNYQITYLAPEGQRVKAGMPLVTFDGKELQKKLELKRSELATARKKLDNTRMQDEHQLEELKLRQAELAMELDKAGRKVATLDETVALNEQQQLKLDLRIAEDEHFLGQRKVDQHRAAARTRADLAQREVNRLALEVAQLEHDLGRLTIPAPKDGMVVYHQDRGGDKVAAGDSVWMGQQLMLIPSLDKMVVKAEIAERDAGKIRVGQAVRIRLDANPEVVYQGQIQSLGKLFRQKSRHQPAMVFDALVTLAQPDPELMRPGMAARLEILTRDLGEVLLVPARAVQQHGDGHRLQLRTALGQRDQQVTLGPRLGDQVVISQGLEAGQEIRL